MTARPVSHPMKTKTLDISNANVLKVFLILGYHVITFFLWEYQDTCISKCTKSQISYSNQMLYDFLTDHELHTRYTLAAVACTANTPGHESTVTQKMSACIFSQDELQ